MELKYFFKPVLIRRITSIYHYKKKRGFFHPSHVHASYGHEIIYLDYGKMTKKKETAVPAYGSVTVAEKLSSTNFERECNQQVRFYIKRIFSCYMEAILKTFEIAPLSKN